MPLIGVWSVALTTPLCIPSGFVQKWTTCGTKLKKRYLLLVKKKKFGSQLNYAYFSMPKTKISYGKADDVFLPPCLQDLCENCACVHASIQFRTILIFLYIFLQWSPKCGCQTLAHKYIVCNGGRIFCILTITFIVVIIILYDISALKQ